MGQRNSTSNENSKRIANPRDDKYWRSENLQNKREIGRGPNSYVLEAQNIKAGVRCAVKILEYSNRDDYAYEYAMEKARRAYKINKLSNINLVHTYLCEVIEVENNFSLKHKCAIIMDYFERNLQSLIMKQKATNQRFNDRTLLKFALDLTHGLAAAHKVDIYHGNIKDENIFWCEKSKLMKIGDFDIPESYTISKKYTPERLTYRPPELSIRVQKGSFEGMEWAKADIYSLGIALLKLCLNKNILTPTDLELLPHLISDVFKINEKLSSLIEMMLKTSPEERWSAIQCFKFLQSDFLRHNLLVDELNEAVTYDQREAKCLIDRGLLYKRSDDHRAAMSFFEDARNVIIQAGCLNYYDRILIANSLQYSALAYYDLKDYANAITFYLKCLDIKSRYLSNYEIWFTFGSIGRLYTKIGDPKRGLYYYLKAFQALKKENTETYNSNAPKYFECIANTYESLGDFATALENHMLCLEILKKQFGETSPRYGKCLRSISRVFKCLGDIENSKTFETMARKITS